ncbi:GNAT family N-acetyltransferase [Pseudomonas paeninsulae]|uniref:GNAT family N-acetyltransferase n=1 Tax=Pseudomonas paeninsulae TaxID=3110772 RepID=UPI002D778B7D|nr:GNAT family N-acetyltransferase [Pseudomonas sp. IT1137]
MSEFEIKILTAKNWELYKSARLSSLRDSPDSFGSTYDQETTLSDAEWQSRLDLKFRDIDALPLVAELDGKPVGVAWGFIHKPDLRIAHIYQMWVSPELRGKGIAKSLLREIEAWAISRGCGLMALAVTTSNEAAVNLYRSFGFIAAGQLEELRIGSERMVQPMVMKLNSAAQHSNRSLRSLGRAKARALT